MAGQLFAYDANGATLTGLGGRSIAYDARSRPVSVTHQGVTATYAYGPDDERITKTVAGQTTLYLGADIERDSAGVWTKHIGADVRRVGPTTSWLHRDHLSSVRAVTDAAGAAAQASAYAPYGARSDTAITAAAPRSSKGYIGERDDPETGLLYLHARWYDPVLARFVTPDWWEVVQAGVGTNRYAYSDNDPINKSDPNGHLFEAIGRGLRSLDNALSDALGVDRGARDFHRASGLSWSEASRFRGVDLSGAIGSMMSSDRTSVASNRLFQWGARFGYAIEKLGKSAYRGIRGLFSKSPTVGQNSLPELDPGKVGSAAGLGAGVIGGVAIDGAAGPVTVEGLLGGATRAPSRRSQTEHYTKTGGLQQAEADFNALGLRDVRSIDTTFGSGRVGQLADGGSVSVRSGSSDGFRPGDIGSRATIEINRPGHPRAKVRYE